MAVNDRGGSRLFRAYAAFVLLGLTWGFSYLLIKVAVHDLTPGMLVFIRLVTATLAMVVFILVTRRPFTRPGFRSRVGPFILAGFLGTIIPFLLISWAQVFLTSGMASILNATTPLWTALLAWWATPSERPSALNYLGVGVAFLGTGVLIGPGILTHPLELGSLAAIAVLAGALSYAGAAITQRRLLPGVDPYEVSFWQLGLSTLVLAPVAAVGLGANHFTLIAVGAASLLGVAGSALAYVLYYYILNHLGATRATSVTFTIPLTAVLWGALLLHEAITVQIIFGMVVILAGIFLTMRRRRPGRVPAAESGEPVTA